MQRDLLDYCIYDVEILTAACLKFRQQLMDTVNVCPFTEACTIASACNKVYRLVSVGGKERQVNILHAAKQQEVNIQGVKVDGYCEETRQVFEFHGCYYHGCTICFQHRRDEPLHDEPTATLNSRYEGTVGKTERLRELEYEVIEMWKCQFRRQLKENEELRKFTESHPLVTLSPLNHRDAFYGGRTGNTFEYYNCPPGEKIKYVDYGKFPIGHPKVYVGEECPKDIAGVEGVVKCKILPPRDLYHPVLPVKMNNKLMFVLCRTCGEQTSQDDCNHTEEERRLTGTWVSDEILKAIDKEYEIKKVYEIWSYQMDRFDKNKKVGGLFTEMVNKFFKIKQQASGWPQHCTSLEQRHAYIENFFEMEDVKLEFADILNNPGLRSLAKLMLNSFFWGKLGQREAQAKTKIVNNLSEFFSILTNPAIRVNSVLPVNEDTLIVNWEYIEEACNPLATVNVVIASYVTTQTRLKLYSYLEQLGDRVLYYDTDSAIYISKPGEWDVPTGEFIGDMTDELESYGSGSYISEFVSGGLKNYAYKVFSTNKQQDEIVCKVKGISLNYSVSQLVNFETINLTDLCSSKRGRSTAEEGAAKPVYITSKNIRRTKEYEVVTKVESKIYKPNSTKRMFDNDHTSVPYGFKKIKKC
ncbi:hypothetical protein NQ317_018016 [Molorchus minor]|uniref:DNA-directed DNA polymerase n=1 Tax=Molorchus minor TaxID=1323400 RepID=A0ABQ9JT45_9CUCU|nr:hypothetical protein NQ317_018016 [Molorchus minor]